MDATAHSETAQTDTAHTDPAEFKKHLKQYYVVFVALACLTAVTVGVSYLKLNRPVAIAVALVIASIKAGLVGAVFMHLISEKKVIYAVLTLTAVFFLLVLLLPAMTIFEGVHV
jgi:cytochrome c oxidase subunit 4